MKTAKKAVGDGNMNREQLGSFHARVDDLKRRINERTLNYEWVMGRLQQIIEGVVSEIAPPDGGRIHFVDVTYDESRSWKEAVTAAGPDTPSNYDIWKVGGEHYPPGPAGQVTKRLVLVNFGRTIESAQPALDWAAKYRFPIDSARATLAIPENHPTLHRTLGQNPMVVVSLEECNLSGNRSLPCGWWGDAERKAFLLWFGIRWYGSYWFAFLCDQNQKVVA